MSESQSIADTIAEWLDEHAGHPIRFEKVEPDGEQVLPDATSASWTRRGRGSTAIARLIGPNREGRASRMGALAAETNPPRLENREVANTTRSAFRTADVRGFEDAIDVIGELARKYAHLSRAEDWITRPRAAVQLASTFLEPWIKDKAVLFDISSRKPVRGNVHDNRGSCPSLAPREP